MPREELYPQEATKVETYYPRKLGEMGPGPIWTKAEKLAGPAWMGIGKSIVYSNEMIFSTAKWAFEHGAESFTLILAHSSAAHNRMALKNTDVIKAAEKVRENILAVTVETLHGAMSTTLFDYHDMNVLEATPEQEDFANRKEKLHLEAIMREMDILQILEEQFPEMKDRFQVYTAEDAMEELLGQGEFVTEQQRRELSITLFQSPAFLNDMAELMQKVVPGLWLRYMRGEIKYFPAMCRYTIDQLYLSYLLLQAQNPIGIKLGPPTEYMPDIMLRKFIEGHYTSYTPPDPKIQPASVYLIA